MTLVETIAAVGGHPVEELTAIGPIDPEAPQLLARAA
jgi:hypothetical protein